MFRQGAKQILFLTTTHGLLPGHLRIAPQAFGRNSALRYDKRLQLRNQLRRRVLGPAHRAQCRLAATLDVRNCGIVKVLPKRLQRLTNQIQRYTTTPA